MVAMVICGGHDDLWCSASAPFTPVFMLPMFMPAITFFMARKVFTLHMIALYFYLFLVYLHWCFLLFNA